MRLGRGPRGVLWQLFYFAEAIVVWRRVRTLGLSHLHTHFADTGTDSALLASRFEPEWSFSITVHGPDEFAESAGNRLAEKLRRARLVVVISEDAKRKARAALDGDGEARIEVVRLGIDLERFAPAGAPAAKDDDAGGDPVEILCLGRLVERKGQAVLLRAVAALDGRGVPVRLTLAGDGPDRPALEQLAGELGIAGSVTFTGVVSQAEAIELYRRAGIFCLASFSEGLPAVLMEAMASQVPVISTRIDGIPELVADGENGLLVDPGDSEALGVALERLLTDPDLRARLGQEGRRTIERDYELGRQADRMLELFTAELG